MIWITYDLRSIWLFQLNSEVCKKTQKSHVNVISEMTKEGAELLFINKMVPCNYYHRDEYALDTSSDIHTICIKDAFEGLKQAENFPLLILLILFLKIQLLSHLGIDKHYSNKY